MDEMSLQEQIQRLEEMKIELGEFCSLMHETMDSMQSQIKELRSNGLPIETEQAYQQRYYTPARADVEQVIDNIINLHYAYIDEVIDYLKRALNQ